MKSSSLLWFRLVATPLMGLILFVSLNLLDPLDDILSYYQKNGGIGQMLSDLACTILFANLFSEVNIYLSGMLDKRVSWEHQPVKRLLLQLILSFCVGTVAGLVLLRAYQFFYADYADPLMHAQILVVGFLTSLSILLIYIGLLFFERWRKVVLEAETLKRESVEARYEALKSQLDPHFLFNNLNTLTAIVEENPRQAVDFIENLSLVYRYILQKRDQTLVTVADELDLARSYLYLLKKRFGDSLHTTIDVPTKYHAWQIPPMTLQLLLENAVKHNVVSRAHPLHIRLTVNDAGDLMVTNTIQKRLVSSVTASLLNGPSEGTAISQATPLPSLPSGVGLRNIQNRYRLLGQHQPVVTETDREFSVQVPLIAA